MAALHEKDLPVPRLHGWNRHAVLMDMARGIPLVQVCSFVSNFNLR